VRQACGSSDSFGKWVWPLWPCWKLCSCGDADDDGGGGGGGGDNAWTERLQHLHRQKSRLLFLPHAGNPKSFSGVQLKNYLKGAKINSKVTDDYLWNVLVLLCM